MNLKKIIASVAAAAVAVSTMAVSAFAATVTLDSEYKGGWSATSTIPKSEFAAIGGDVKVVLEVERHDPLVGDGNYLIKPMNMCLSWDAITSTLTSDTAIAKGDGFIVIGKDVTSVEFVVPESTWSAFVDNDGGDSEAAGLTFQANDVIVKSAELSAGAPEGEFTIVSEEESAEIMKNGVPASTADTVADTTADTTVTETTSTATGNTSAAVIVSVMALAGVAAVATKKSK